MQLVLHVLLDDGSVEHVGREEKYYSFIQFVIISKVIVEEYIERQLRLGKVERKDMDIILD